MKKWILLLLIPATLMACENGDQEDSEPEGQELETERKPPLPDREAAPSDPEDALPEFATYHNSRFDFCVKFPVGMQGQGESENRDGQVFIDEERDIRMTVFGSNAPEGSIEEEYQLTIDTYEGYEITFDDPNQNWFAISGEKEGRVKYTFTMLREEQFANLEIEYPQSEIHTFYPVLQYILDSFPGCEDREI